MRHERDNNVASMTLLPWLRAIIPRVECSLDTSTQDSDDPDEDRKGGSGREKHADVGA
jgi:hypothetical protein